MLLDWCRCKRTQTLQKVQLLSHQHIPLPSMMFHRKCEANLFLFAQQWFSSWNAAMQDIFAQSLSYSGVMNSDLTFGKWGLQFFGVSFVTSSTVSTWIISVVHGKLWLDVLLLRSVTLLHFFRRFLFRWLLDSGNNLARPECRSWKWTQLSKKCVFTQGQLGLDNLLPKIN